MLRSRRPHHPASRDTIAGTALRPRSIPSSPLFRALLLSVPFLLFLALLGGIEAIVRATKPHVSSLELFVTAPDQQARFSDRRKVSIFEGDPLLFWKLKPDLDRAMWDFTVVSTNRQGVRHDRALGPKTPEFRRIVCLGDSVTFGYRTPVVWPDRPDQYDADQLPYPMLMERWLRASNPGRGIEVVTLAVPGYSSHQGLAWLRRDIAELEPDLVIACFGWNDINRRHETDRDMMRTDWPRVTGRRLLPRSQALIRVVRWLHPTGGGRRPNAGEDRVLRVPPRDFVSNHLEIAGLARAHGASIAVIGPVYRDAVTHPEEAELMTRQRDALRVAMNTAGISYLEIPELTESHHPDNARLFGEHIHPTHLGHRLMASRLLDFLESRGMLWDLSLSAALESPQRPLQRPPGVPRSER
jgi:lysophospholipase L1-like esterase